MSGIDCMTLQAQSSENAPAFDDVISVEEVARILKKSVSWCYLAAKELGAIKIRGSVIFRMSSLMQALDKAALEANIGNKRSVGELPAVKKRKTRRQDHWPKTDPAKHGIADLFTMSGLSCFGFDPSNPLAGVDLHHAMRELKLLPGRR